MKRRAVLTGLAAAALSQGVGAATSAVWPFRIPTNRRQLLIAGSRMMLGMNEALGREFVKRNPLVDVVVEPSGSLPALIALKRGAIDLAAVDRNFRAAEDAEGISNFLVARNGLGVMVHRSSPLKSLTYAQARDVFAGAIVNWQLLGGPNAPITVVTRVRGAPGRQFMEEVILGGNDIVRTAIDVVASADVVKRVAADARAIGFIALKDRQAADPVNYLAIDDVAPSRETILSNRYPFTQSLYLVEHHNRPAPTGQFIRFACSEAGQRIVEQQGLIATYA